MNWISFTALFFVLWWLVLFAILPFGVKTQEDDGDITLGTIPSAPRGPHMLRAVLWTTLVTAAIMAVLYVVTNVLGFGFDDIPRIVPDFK
ncbi:hypothetical protein ASD50_06600 [Mesorhizobium sp. Root552]|uniref:DUF1467 family protein n=1 Tax=Mesorhizobium sp. Root552 TaxID=1736555 RepID=UPI0006F3B094|nr:DUF1467 family protein [Mesorhizobium sp. Root552]KQZ19171.1 hypothetical protein ASD50_06600 [Mesorhizobium sp. Root552]